MNVAKARSCCVFVLLLTIAISFIFAPFTVQAAAVYLHKNYETVYVGDTFVVDVKLSNENELINVVDGSLVYDKNFLKLEEISTGDSIFELWPVHPYEESDTSRISFVGGIPGGYSGKNALIFKAIFTAEKAGDAAVILSNDLKVHLNDGEGTQVIPSIGAMEFKIMNRPEEVSPRNEWEALIGDDTVAPNSFEITIGKEAQLYDGKYFIYFSTTDDGSGILHYEVQEGENDFIEAESPYVLKDQTLTQTISVKAIDNAGNEFVSTLNKEALPAPELPEPTEKQFPTLVYVILFVLTVILSFTYILIKKRKKTAHDT